MGIRYVSKVSRYIWEEDGREILDKVNNAFVLQMRILDRGTSDEGSVVKGAHEEVF